MKMTSEHISNFFSAVRSFDTLYWDNRCKVEKAQFNAFKQQFIQHKQAFETLRKTETPYYNLFDILNIRHLEETLHTPFLHHLLDPLSSHEQSALYLDAFLSSVLNLPCCYMDVQNFSISEELSTAYGRIDLIMSFIYEGKRKMIIIENKIYAGDQADQLQRYFDYARKNTTSEEDVLLVYLTPSGHRASANSMHIAEQRRLRDGGILVEKSYRNDIIPWLQTTVDQTISDKVKQSIIQYLMTLHTL